jgi:hypothetical protein
MPDQISLVQQNNPVFYQFGIRTGSSWLWSPIQCEPSHININNDDLFCIVRQDANYREGEQNLFDISEFDQTLSAFVYGNYALRIFSNDLSEALLNEQTTRVENLPFHHDQLVRFRTGIRDNESDEFVWANWNEGYVSIIYDSVTIQGNDDIPIFSLDSYRFDIFTNSFGNALQINTEWLSCPEEEQQQEGPLDIRLIPRRRRSSMSIDEALIRWTLARR